MPMEKEACPNQRWIVPLPDYLLSVKASTIIRGGGGEGGEEFFYFSPTGLFPK